MFLIPGMTVSFCDPGFVEGEYLTILEKHSYITFHPSLSSPVLVSSKMHERLSGWCSHTGCNRTPSFFPCGALLLSGPLGARTTVKRYLH